MSFPAGSAPDSPLKLVSPASVSWQDIHWISAPALQHGPNLGRDSHHCGSICRPGLHILQGSALLPEEFTRGIFSPPTWFTCPCPATMTCLSRPGPDLNCRNNGAVRGAPFLGRRTSGLWRLNAKLVFLSSVNAAGDPAQHEIYRPGLVTAFLDAGAKSVIASLVGGF